MPRRLRDTYEAYNFPAFLAEPNDALFEPFQSYLRPGDEAPDFEAIRLANGERVRLADYTSTARLGVVVEFGSIT